MPMKRCSDMVSPTWTAYPNNPVIDGDEIFGSGYRTEDSNVVKVGNRYYMAKSSGPTDQLSMRVYMLESDSLFGPYSKVQDNPIVDEDAFRRVQQLFYFGDEWYLRTGDCFWTTSESDFPAGWEKQTADDISLGRNGEWDDYTASIIAALQMGSLWYHIYAGSREGEYYDLGVAWSSRLHKGPYTKCPCNPVIRKGAGTEWDSLRICQTEVIAIGDTIFLFYEGRKTGGVWQVGMAYLPFPTQKGVKMEKPIITPSMVSSWGSGCDMCANPTPYYENGVLYLLVDGFQKRGRRWRYTGIFFQHLKKPY